MRFRGQLVRLSQLVADSLTGALIQTAASGARWVLSTQSAVDRMQGYTGLAAEMFPGLIQVAKFVNAGTGVTLAYLNFVAPTIGNGPSPGTLILQHQTDSTGTHSSADLRASNAEVRLSSINDSAALIGGVGGVDSVTVDDTGIKLSSANGVHIGPGHGVVGLDSGRVTALTNASSQLVITHQLGVAPASVLLGGASCMARVQGWDAATITVLCYTPAGALVGNAVSETVSWLALS